MWRIFVVALVLLEIGCNVARLASNSLCTVKDNLEFLIILPGSLSAEKTGRFHHARFMGLCGPELCVMSDRHSISSPVSPVPTSVFPTKHTSHQRLLQKRIKSPQINWKAQFVHLCEPFCECARVLKPGPPALPHRKGSSCLTPQGGLELQHGLNAMGPSTPTQTILLQTAESCSNYTVIFS